MTDETKKFLKRGLIIIMVIVLLYFGQLFISALLGLGLLQLLFTVGFIPAMLFPLVLIVGVPIYLWKVVSKLSKEEPEPSKDA